MRMASVATSSAVSEANSLAIEALWWTIFASAPESASEATVRVSRRPAAASAAESASVASHRKRSAPRARSASSSVGAESPEYASVDPSCVRRNPYDVSS